MINAEQLKSYYERALNLEAEIKEIRESLKELYMEASSDGFDVPTLKKIVALSKKDPDKMNEEESIMYTYMVALKLR